MREKEEIKRLSQKIDAVLQDRNPPEDDAEVRFLQSLAGMDLSGESRKRDVERRRLLAMQENRKKEHWFQRLMHVAARRPVLVGACSLLLVLGISGIVIRYYQARNLYDQVMQSSAYTSYAVEPEPPSMLRLMLKAPLKIEKNKQIAPGTGAQVAEMMAPPLDAEEYGIINEGRFVNTLDEPLSTFSIDVDTASYANVRRFIGEGTLPPKDAVRIEELINYFRYDYPEPAGDRPFSVTTEMAGCPWNPGHQLVLIGLQGRRIDLAGAPPNNLVFLLDVSGSMDEPNKLPLLKASFRLLVQELRPQDRIAIVVYAGAAGLVLPSTSGGEKEKILAALDGLEAGGSTAGGAGIKLAYQIARQNFIRNGNNRVILATDGDFNVGITSDGELERLIEEERAGRDLPLRPRLRHGQPTRTPRWRNWPTRGTATTPTSTACRRPGRFWWTSSAGRC